MRCKGNTDEAGIGQTSAVGIFLDDASPYGVMDMSGNVWEWMLTEYDIHSSSIGKRLKRRVIRGGSWLNSQFSARLAARSHCDAAVGGSDLGFRVVLVPRPF